MRAKDLMNTDVVTIRDDAPVSQLCDVMQEAHANGLPVLNAHGELVGIVTEDDILYGTMGVFDKNGSAVLVREIMTSPAICATEDTDVVELSRMLWGMRIHRIPILLDGRVTGVVTALDVVRAVAEGDARVSTPSQVIALLNALTQGDLEAIRAKLTEARGACLQLGHDDVASIVAEAHGALSGGDLKTYRKKVETAVAKLGHLR